MGKSWRHLHAGGSRGIVPAVKSETIEIPTDVLMSVETLDELQDWLTAQNPKVIAELRAARREDKAGKFKAWRW